MRFAHDAVEASGPSRLLSIGELAEIGSFMAAGDRRSHREMIERKLAELTEQQHRLDVARAVLEHGRRCPADEPTRCPRFRSIVEGQLRGLSLEESHAQAH
jgi:hypothetical protein